MPSSSASVRIHEAFETILCFVPIVVIAIVTANVRPLAVNAPYAYPIAFYLAAAERALVDAHAAPRMAKIAVIRTAHPVAA